MRWSYPEGSPRHDLCFSVADQDLSPSFSQGHYPRLSNFLLSYNLLLCVAAGRVSFALYTPCIVTSAVPLTAIISMSACPRAHHLTCTSGQNTFNHSSNGRMHAECSVAPLSGRPIGGPLFRRIALMCRLDAFRGRLRSAVESVLIPCFYHRLIKADGVPRKPRNKWQLLTTPL